jgi:Tfp pilus assembly protein PilP
MSRRRNSLLPALLFIAAISMPLAGYAEEKKAPKNPASPDTREFTYTSRDRRDPFEPAHARKAAATRKAALTSEKAGYDLEELKLVGVIRSGAVSFAMMEDVQGKGVLFKKGDFLNKNLWVFDILEDKVILAYRLKGDIRKIPMDIPRK